MEDALVRYSPEKKDSTSLGLNPCFNGRCTRTLNISDGKRHFLELVLILVLMEDALVLSLS